jgi:transglutaminase-like putative cysteine protease
MRKFFILFLAVSAFLSLSTEAFPAKDRSATVTFEVNLIAPADVKTVGLWMPYPLSDEWQDITDIHVRGDYDSVSVYAEPLYGNKALYAQWTGRLQQRKLVYSFLVKRKEQSAGPIAQDSRQASKKEFSKYLTLTDSNETNRKLRQYADLITGGKNTEFERARSVYDWVVDNMVRDPEVKGCGLGDVEKLLTTRSGKCADISSVFVALARAAGIPAREVFGIRIPSGNQGDMTKAQHCWAEFYLYGNGWIPADPADVRKIILEKKLTIQEAAPYREYYFGKVDENRIAFGTGRNLVLNPPQKSEPLTYFMYPYAEADGKPLNEDLFGFNIGYRIHYTDRRK